MSSEEAKAVEAEREAVVRFLRGDYVKTFIDEKLIDIVADGIESGAHVHGRALSCHYCNGQARLDMLGNPNEPAFSVACVSHECRARGPIGRTSLEAHRLHAKLDKREEPNDE